MGMGLFFGVMKMGISCDSCTAFEYTRNQWTAHFEKVNCAEGKFHLNKKTQKTKSNKQMKRRNNPSGLSPGKYGADLSWVIKIF